MTGMRLAYVLLPRHTHTHTHTHTRSVAKLSLYELHKHSHMDACPSSWLVALYRLIVGQIEEAASCLAIVDPVE